MKTYDDVFKTPGAISWSELITGDPQGAGAFYGALFGWKFDTMDMGSSPYQVIRVGDAAIGGIMGKPPGSPADMPPSWGPYVTVAQLDDTLAAVKRLGGGVLVEPMDVPGVGRMAVIRDPQGAALSVIQYNMPA
jgi:predicted enzyme related to lactoylglutathione lyase